ncbi:MAG: hypothetical protein U0517_01445 [Candidatus Andersenbacteria bacterium]
MSYLLPAPLLLAHEFEKNATVNVTVHVDPNDEPIASQPTTVFVEVTGEECGCTLTAQQAGQVVARFALTQANSTTFVEGLSEGPLTLTVATHDDSFDFEYYVQPPPSQALPLALAIGATVLVTAILVGVLAWFGRKKKATTATTQPAEVAAAPALPPQKKFPAGALSLVIIGLILLGVGVFYVLGSHSILEQIPGLATLPHSAHVYIGGGGAVLGLLSLLLGEVLRRRSGHSDWTDSQA